MNASTARGREAARVWVEVRSGAFAFHALQAEWKELHGRSTGAPFLSWEWLECWWRKLASNRTPLLICAREEGNLIGLLPLAEEKLRLGGRRLSFLGERWAGADYLDVLAEEGREAEVAELLYGYLSRLEDFDVLELDGMAEGSPSVPILKGLFGESLSVSQRYVCPGIELSGTWQEVLKRSKRADNFKRRLRQIKELQGFEFRVIREASDAAQAFDRFLELHERRWASQGGSDALGRPTLQNFHRELVVQLAEAGWLRFEELWAEGACRASIYGIETRQGYCFYQSGYDPDWGRRSVGLVLLGLSIEAAVSRGVQVYDFLRGTEPYKFDWSTGTRNTVLVRFIRPGLQASLFRMGERSEKTMRSIAHKMLPVSGVEALRWLRRWGQRQGFQGGGRQ